MDQIEAIMIVFPSILKSYRWFFSLALRYIKLKIHVKEHMTIWSRGLLWGSGSGEYGEVDSKQYHRAQWMGLVVVPIYHATLKSDSVIQCHLIHQLREIERAKCSGAVSGFLIQPEEFRLIGKLSCMIVFSFQRLACKQYSF